MSKISELHELTDSLTAKEQNRIRAVLKSQVRGNSNQQLDLFQALLNGQSENKGNDAVQQLSPRHRKNLPTLMRRLYELILKNLGGPGNDAAVSNRLATALSAIRALYEKQLNDQAEKVLRKAKKLARAFEESNYHLQLIEWERKFIINQKVPDASERLQILFQEQQLIAQQMNRQMETRHLRDQALELNRNKTLSPQEKNRRLQEIVDHPLLQDSTNSKEIRSRINARATLGTCIFELGDSEKAVEIYAQLLDFWEARPTWINEYPESYLEDFTLFQYMVLRDSSRIDLLEKQLEIIKQLPIARPDLQFRFKYYGFQMQIVVYLNFLKWREARETILEAWEWMESDTKSFTPSHRLAFLYNFAVFYFFQDEFTPAKRFTLQIIEERSKQKRIDLRAAARLLNLVIYLEEQDYDFAEYQLRATRAWLRRQALEGPFAKAFLRLVQQIIDGSGHDLHQRIAEHKDQLSSLPPIQGSNEIIIWMESKIRGTSLRAVCEQLIPEMR
ncbi:MAG: hypothetical protein AAGN35_19705 [Bacteroidota bacterium]